MSHKERGNYRVDICLREDCANRDVEEYPVIAGKCESCHNFNDYKQGVQK